MFRDGILRPNNAKNLEIFLISTSDSKFCILNLTFFNNIFQFPNICIKMRNYLFRIQIAELPGIWCWSGAFLHCPIINAAINLLWKRVVITIIIIIIDIEFIVTIIFIDTGAIKFSFGFVNFAYQTRCTFIIVIVVIIILLIIVIIVSNVQWQPLDPEKISPEDCQRRWKSRHGVRVDRQRWEGLHDQVSSAEWLSCICISW